MATAADAELILKLYDLRREDRMRTARNWVVHEAFAQQVPGGFMAHTIALVQGYPATRERCQRLRDHLDRLRTKTS